MTGLPSMSPPIAGVTRSATSPAPSRGCSIGSSSRRTGGEIKVELRNGDQAALTVCDEGPGVPAEERELIFQRFQRGRAAGSTAGFGLGLAIGRELAERMGGDLVLERTELPGATFTLRLPVATAQEEGPLAVA